jgi:16S rRNA (cytosine967-C5)-methyltransferase
MPQASDHRPSRSTTVSPARRIVLPHLEAKAARFPELFPIPLDVSALNERDARLAITIDRDVTIRWTTLRAIIEPLLSQPWNRQHHAVIAALLSGAAQLLLMDRIPDHAAIGESVGWSRTTGGRGASGVINAVLRKVARMRVERLEKADPTQTNHLVLPDGSGWLLSSPVFAGEDASRIAMQSGGGRQLIDRLIATDGLEEAERIAMHTLCHPPVILHGAGEHADLEPHQDAGFYVLRSGASLTSVLETFPNAIVQDPTSAGACRSTTAIVPELIVDWCAGRGTKTRQLAYVHPGAKVLATDASPLRRGALAAMASRTPGVEACDPASVLSEYAGRVDLLLLDVPCSNSGVLARRAEARHRQNAATRARLVDLQRQIAADSLALLAPGGMLLWATCSIDPEENEKQVEWLTKWHPLEVCSIHRETGQGVPGDSPSMWRDGGFFAQLRRVE